ncbi:MAG: polyprenyl synthetase family protein [Bacteroidales bacterium]|jgi:geranylgeranyl diphosphate synthase type II|nr:polyprenyl synthetase family protein [Bacteroidales bacterium]
MYTHSDLKEVVDRALVNLSYNTEAPKLIDPVKYVLSKGGKRLRPVMALMSCNLFTDKIDDAILPAAGLEVFHNFTLVHDDIMDKAPVRRGLPTVHNKWNENQAILSGDVMAFIANECILQAPSSCLLRVFRVFNKAAVEVCVGQQLDMDFEKAAIVRECEYLRMIELKTAVLLASSVKIGAIIGGAEEKDSDLLYEFGKNLGLAFQIQDDMLDVWGDVKVFGKTSGGDIVANKKTLPLVKALELAKGSKLKELQKLISGSTINPDEKISRVKAIFEELDIKDITEILAYDYINKAFGFLQKVNVDESRKKEMTNLAISLIGRKQ